VVSNSGLQILYCHVLTEKCAISHAVSSLKATRVSNPGNPPENLGLTWLETQVFMVEKFRGE